MYEINWTCLWEAVMSILLVNLDAWWVAFSVSFWVAEKFKLIEAWQNLPTACFPVKHVKSSTHRGNVLPKPRYFELTFTDIQYRNVRCKAHYHVSVLIWGFLFAYWDVAPTGPVNVVLARNVKQMLVAVFLSIASFFNKLQLVILLSALPAALLEQDHLGLWL